jgi:hypothetical protein
LLCPYEFKQRARTPKSSKFFICDYFKRKNIKYQLSV